MSLALAAKDRERRGDPVQHPPQVDVDHRRPAAASTDTVDEPIQAFGPPRAQDDARAHHLLGIIGDGLRPRG